MNRRELLKLFPGALVVAAVPTVIAGAAAAHILPIDSPKRTVLAAPAEGERNVEVLRWHVGPSSYTSSLAVAELQDASGRIWSTYSFNELCGVEVVFLPEERFIMRGPPQIVVRSASATTMGYVVTRDAEHPRAVRIYDFNPLAGSRNERVGYVTQQRL